MTFTSIVPSEMTQPELSQIIGNLITSKILNLSTATVLLENGQQYRVDVKDIDDYKEWTL